MQNGPPVHISSSMFESKHREIKAMAVATPCKKFILKTIAKRYLLSLMYQRFSSYEDKDVTYSLSEDHSDDYFEVSDYTKVLKNVEIGNYRYKPETIIAASFEKISPEFGEIDRIYLSENKIYFRYIPLVTSGFDDHLFAWRVSANTSERKVVEYDSIANRTPCVPVIIKGIQYVTTRCRL